MRVIEINEIPKILDASPICINTMFIGDTGVGKTTVIEKYAEERGFYLKTLILSQLEASESLGIPIQSEYEYKGIKYPCLRTAIPTWVFELAEHPKSMLYLDEFFCAEPSVMNSFLNFLSQKKISGINLKHVKVVAASNIGKYTYELDTNMMSRFCMFYTVNKTYSKYIKDNRIVNDYKDENVLEGEIFEQRSLKPRCQEQLSKVKDEYLAMFYEGFTNMTYTNYHPIDNISAIIAPFVNASDPENPYITDENLNSLAPILKKRYPRIKNWAVNFRLIRNCTFNKELLWELLECH